MRTLNKFLFILYFVILFWYGLFIKFLYGTQYLNYLKLLPEVVLTLFLITCYSITRTRGFQLIDISLLIIVSIIINILVVLLQVIHLLLVHRMQQQKQTLKQMILLPKEIGYCQMTFQIIIQLMVLKLYFLHLQMSLQQIIIVYL